MTAEITRYPVITAPWPARRRPDASSTWSRPTSRAVRPARVIVRIVDGTSAHNGRPFDEFSRCTAPRSSPAGRSCTATPRDPRRRPGRAVQREAQKATQFIQLANQADTPLLFLQNITGYMVGKDYEQGGIIKHGAQMINAISNSTVPHLSVIIGASFSAATTA